MWQLIAAAVLAVIGYGIVRSAGNDDFGAAALAWACWVAAVPFAIWGAVHLL